VAFSHFHGVGSKAVNGWMEKRRDDGLLLFLKGKGKGGEIE